MCIDRKKFLELCDFYPYSHKILKFKAYTRRKYFREVKNKVIDFEESSRPKHMQTDAVIKTGDLIIDSESPQVLEKENTNNSNNNINLNINMRDKKKNKLSLSEIEESNEIPNFIQLVDDNQLKEQTNSNNVSMKNEIEMIE